MCKEIGRAPPSSREQNGERERRSYGCRDSPLGQRARSLLRAARVSLTPFAQTLTIRFSHQLSFPVHVSMQGAITFFRQGRPHPVFYPNDVQ